MEPWYIQSLDDVPKEKQKKKVAVVIGRMQPPTIAHKKIIENALKKYGEVIVAVVKGKKPDPKKSPFPPELIIQILQKIFKNNPKVHIQLFSRGFIGDIIDFARKKGLEPVVLFCGSDRVNTYEGQIRRYRDRFNVDIKVQEIKRKGDDVSATKVRNAIKSNDIESFKKMTPEEEHEFFDRLRSYLQ